MVVPLLSVRKDNAAVLVVLCDRCFFRLRCSGFASASPCFASFLGFFAKFKTGRRRGHPLEFSAHNKDELFTSWSYVSSVSCASCGLSSARVPKRPLYSNISSGLHDDTWRLSEESLSRLSFFFFLYSSVARSKVEANVHLVQMTTRNPIHAVSLSSTAFSSCPFPLPSPSFAVCVASCAPYPCAMNAFVLSGGENTRRDR